MVRGFLMWPEFSLCYNGRFWVHSRNYKSSGPSQKYSLGSQVPIPQEGLGQNENMWLFALVPSRDDNCILIANGHLTACYTYVTFGSIPNYIFNSFI